MYKYKLHHAYYIHSQDYRNRKLSAYGNTIYIIYIYIIYRYGRKHYLQLFARFLLNYRNSKLSARFAHMNGLWKTLLFYVLVIFCNNILCTSMHISFKLHVCVSVFMYGRQRLSLVLRLFIKFI